MNDQLWIYSSSIPSTYYQDELSQDDSFTPDGFSHAIQDLYTSNKSDSKSRKTSEDIKAKVKLETNIYGFTIQKIILMKFWQGLDKQPYLR